jgi:hypothetical protein
MDYMNIMCPLGKEMYNGKCVKVCEAGKTRNFKTGRCNKIKTKVSKKMVKSVKTIKSVKIIGSCPSGKELHNGKCLKTCEANKTRNPLTGRCVKPKSLKKRPSPMRMVPTNKEIGKNVYQRYNVDQETKNYLNELVFNGSASKMRNLAKKYNLFIPLEEYPNDAIMKEYVVNEILDLSRHHARDISKSEIIRLPNVKYVIDDDIELSVILKGYHPQMPSPVF